MPEAPRKYFLTTPIYYVNARPHIGHAYTTIVADVLARRHRMLGDDVFFLTGTDEHGQKIERSAAAAGIPPQQFADQVSHSFRDLWDRMGITYDDFIRTTETRHHRAVQKLFTTLQEQGKIYLDSYTGAYCVSDEAFVDAPAGTPCPDCGRLLETVTEENYFFKLSEYEQPLIEKIASGELTIEPDTRRNEVLSFLRSGLRDLSISRSSFTWGIPVPPPSPLILSETKDPCISPFSAPPLAPTQDHVIYVWLDALANYMTAVGYGDDSVGAQAMFARYWPADLHIVGKEIIRFHCVYWPAFLMAAGLPLPKKVVAHGWLLFEDSKMSKSKGNIVRTETILDAFGPLCPAQNAAPSKAEQDLFAADILRYFLLREIPFGQDGSFGFDALITRYNADLANGYGNLVSRTLSMIDNYDGGVILPSGTRKSTEFLPNASWLTHGANYHFAANNFNAYLDNCTVVIKSVDVFLNERKPWKEDRTSERGKEFVSDTLYMAAEMIRIITLLLHPILPYATTRVWQQLGLDPAALTTHNTQHTTLSWGGLKPGTRLGPLFPIFPRADKGLAQIMADMETKSALGNSTTQADAATDTHTEFPVTSLASEVVRSPVEDHSPTDPAAGPRTSTFAESSPGGHVAGSAAHTTERPGTPPHHEAAASGIFAGQPADAAPQIVIDDFARVELRVAKVIVAERIPKADKLLRLEVDLGYEKRQILSGIAEWYTPEELLGRRIVVITNLAPRKMRGLESHGMLLAASSEGGKPALATFLDCDDLPLGSRLK